MYLSSIRSWLLLLAYLLVLSDALNIPPGIRDGLIQGDFQPPSNFQVIDLERRAKPKHKPKPQTAPQPAPTSNSKPSSKAAITKPSHKAAVPPKATTPSPSAKPTNVAKCSTSGKFTVCPSSYVSASSIKLEIPRPTKAYDACNLPEIDCFGEFEGFKEVKDPEDWPDYSKAKSTARSIHEPQDGHTKSWLSQRSLQKRGDREYEVFGTGADSLKIESLGYPGRSKLFTDSRAKKSKLTAHAYQFKPNQGVGGFLVQDLKTTPGAAAIEDFVVEHIIEVFLRRLYLRANVLTTEVANGKDVH